MALTLPKGLEWRQPLSIKPVKILRKDENLGCFDAWCAKRALQTPAELGLALRVCSKQKIQKESNFFSSRPIKRYGYRGGKLFTLTHREAYLEIVLRTKGRSPWFYDQSVAQHSTAQRQDDSPGKFHMFGECLAESARDFGRVVGDVFINVVGGVLSLGGCNPSDTTAQKSDLSSNAPDLNSANGCQPRCVSNTSIDLCIGPDQQKKTVTCDEGWSCVDASCARPATQSGDLCPPGDEVRCVLVDQVDICEESNRHSSADCSSSTVPRCGVDRAAYLRHDGVAVEFFASLPERTVRYRLDSRNSIWDTSRDRCYGPQDCSPLTQKILTVDWGDGAKRVDINVTNWPQCTYGILGYFGASAVQDGKVRVTFFTNSCRTCDGGGAWLVYLARTRLLKCWCRDTPLPPG